MNQAILRTEHDNSTSKSKSRCGNWSRGTSESISGSTNGGWNRSVSRSRSSSKN